jgi:hypothetical protein
LHAECGVTPSLSALLHSIWMMYGFPFSVTLRPSPSIVPYKYAHLSAISSPEGSYQASRSGSFAASKCSCEVVDISESAAMSPFGDVLKSRQAVVHVSSYGMFA